MTNARLAKLLAVMIYIILLSSHSMAGIKLNIPQTKALDFLQDQQTNQVFFGGSAGPGKSTLGCYWQLKKRIKYPGTRGLIGRSTLKTLKETTLVTFHDVARMMGLTLGREYRMYDKDQIKFKNGSEILLKQLFYKPSDPDGDEFGSLEITDAFIDESSQVNNVIRNVVKSRIRYRLDEYGLIPKILYTSNPGKNWIKTEFYDKYIAGTLDDDKQFVPAYLKDNDKISKFYEQNLKDLPKHLKERLLYANWNYSDDPSQLCKTEQINSIFTNTFVSTGLKRYITADIARFGKDRIIIRVWSGWRVLARIEERGLRITETANIIRSLADQYKIPMHQVICDEDGLGGGVVDILKCKGFVAASSPLPKANALYGMLKDQCGFYFADKVNNNEVFDPSIGDVQTSIKEELEWLRDKTIDKDAAKRLLPKEAIIGEIGRSPDDMDTFIMRSWFDLANIAGLTII